jgi:hypothetical protein
MSDNLADVVASLQKRVQQLEDRLEIYQLLASYGPAVDSGEARAAAELWVEDGDFDMGGARPAHGHNGIAALYEGDAQQQAIRGGLAHTTGLPKVKLKGDEATAVAYCQVLRPGPGGFDVIRNSANAWDLVRTDDGWRIKLRYARSMDGSDATREVLRKAIGS